MKIRIIRKLRLGYIFLFIVLCTNCYEGLLAEDDGFRPDIRNYTSKEYIGCKFYMGAYDENNKYVAVDSLIYPDLVILKKSDGNQIDREQGLATTYPPRDLEAYNKFGYWEPKLSLIEEISGNTNIVFKFELYDGRFTFTTTKARNGTKSPTIREDGLAW